MSCQDPGGTVVADALCTAAAPAGTQTCSGPPCTVYTTGDPTAANGPCTAPSCTGPQPVAAACPAGYLDVRYEEACGNPLYCGSSWPLCTFLAVAGYGCSGGPSYVTLVSVRQCSFQ